MSHCKVFVLGALALTVCAAGVRAQIPSVPGVPAAPGVPTAPAIPATPAAPVPTIWNKLGITPANCQKCRERCCKSPIGQLLNNMTMPLGMITGALVQPLCPTSLNADQLAALQNSNASPEEKVAAKIKADEAAAAARRAAIRYLGTVDCHYYPEAEDAIIAGLRSDRNECVRLEAALALSRGCCCTKKTVAALTIAANGTDEDKNPAETSERVKAAAMGALMHCMARGVSDQVEPPLPPERPLEPPPPEVPPVALGPVSPGVQTAGYPANAPRAPTNGQLVLSAARLMATNAGVNAQNAAPPTGRRNLADVFASASASATRPAQDEIPFDEALMARGGSQKGGTVRLGFEDQPSAPGSRLSPSSGNRAAVPER